LLLWPVRRTPAVRRWHSGPSAGAVLCSGRTRAASAAHGAGATCARSDLGPCVDARLCVGACDVPGWKLRRGARPGAALIRVLLTNCLPVRPRAPRAILRALDASVINGFSRLIRP